MKRALIDDDGCETREYTSRDGSWRCWRRRSTRAPYDVDPSRSRVLDTLIRDGSSEWRSLCGDEAHMARFPNRHFDLDTVLAARTRPIAVRHDRAFVGFFQPESFASLSGAMSFDDIWREISTATRATRS
jgi:hypothetical protein